MKKGCIVRLKSGSPNLIVIETKNDRVTCGWFLADSTPQFNEFPKACVIKVCDTP
jgi:uncharacterized protein YodC (DUF2158 family)